MATSRNKSISAEALAKPSRREEFCKSLKGKIDAGERHGTDCGSGHVSLLLVAQIAGRSEGQT
jgi:hypothetical protein